jgi:DNA-binding beta-propeller fold protein YncE
MLRRVNPGEHLDCRWRAIPKGIKDTYLNPPHKFSKALRRPLIVLSAWIGICAAVADSLVIAGEPQAQERQSDAPRSVELPTGKMITPTGARGAIFQDLNPGHRAAPDVRANQAAAVSTSPDGRTLAILTSGYNIYNGSDAKPVPELSTEYVFLFDVSGRTPKQLQVVQLPNTFQGLAWAPSSDRFFASGGKDDAVLEFVKNGSAFAAGRTFRLGHQAGVGLNAKPETGGLAVNPDGAWLLATNLQNDSVSLVDLASGQVVAEQDLRPGIIDPKHRGEPGGSFPRCVAWISSDRAYVGSERDREIISLAISEEKIHVVRRIPVHGQPVALLANRKGTRLYAALDNTDQVAIFDTAHDAPIESVAAAAPKTLYPNTKKLGGANSNALALTPDEKTLLVSNGGENAVAVVRLSDRARGLIADRRTEPDRGDRDDDDRRADADHSAVIGLVPTGWYPAGVATSKDGATWFIVNGKSETGPNARGCRQSLDRSNRTCAIANQFISALERAGFLTLPAPTALELARLTKQVAHNNHFDRPEATAADEKIFSLLRAHIKHVIYIIKENRSYDQVLGDLEIGNGDPRLTLFPEKLSPNHHALARNFVTLDNFLVSGEVSWTGWDWSVSAQTNDLRERAEPLAMASYYKGGGGLDGETGLNRNINVGFATSAERNAELPASPSDPDVLPGARDVYATDGPGGEEEKGNLWDAALQRGRTLRNWGFWGENRTYPLPDAPLVRDPYAEKLRVFFPTKASLMPYSDPYYLDFGPALPDFWRVQEWKRELAEFSAKNSAPNLMLVRLGNDHFGSFDHAIDGVNTPETQMADNDYALGLMIEAVANSPFAKDTLVISIEDDACDGPDHVEAHRSVTLFAGPYVRQHALVSKRYTTVSVVKTIEEILGLEPIGLNDALAAPMSDVFDPAVTTWSYKAIVPDILRTTKLPLPPATHAWNAGSGRSSAYWTRVMANQDFSGPDKIDAPSFSRALWRGLKGDVPFPANPVTGTDLRANRAHFLSEGHGL